ncbi:MAG: hypothetical protein A3J83_03820 [Elusimicrobia bacterium RIFOXYA2_FULL_40_6]|nr:MAG: hypothetical protein A3J83_03820 [Elusimicrobia bacterium RIFOXYA2_FULL_40_6]
MTKILLIAASNCKLQEDVDNLIRKLSVKYEIVFAAYPDLSFNEPVLKKNVKYFGFESSEKLNKLFFEEIKENLLLKNDFKLIIIVSRELASVCLKDLRLFYRTAGYVVYLNEKSSVKSPVLNHCDLVLEGREALNNTNLLKLLKNVEKNKVEEKKKLTSIIMLTYNQLKHTKACIESLKKYTDRSYELIIVDNGSTDGTPKYLKSIKGKSIKLILNNSNLAFAKGCNQGIRIAKGDYILLLNNDILLTAGWLGKMIDCLESDKSIGMVGPRSNSAEFLQKADFKKYKNDKDLQRFAQAFSMNYTGDYQKTFWIIGFCMLLHRKVVDQVGLLDERFGPGGYEDYDYCFRVGQAGYKIVIAGDVYIHHEGGKSSVHPEYDKFRTRNRGIFIDKWYKKMLDFVESL